MNINALELKLYLGLKRFCIRNPYNIRFFVIEDPKQTTVKTGQTGQNNRVSHLGKHTSSMFVERGVISFSQFKVNR